MSTEDDELVKRAEALKAALREDDVWGRAVVALERIAAALEGRGAVDMDGADRLALAGLQSAELVPFHVAARELGVDEPTLHLMVRAGTFTMRENGNRAQCIERDEIERFKLGVPRSE